MVILTKKKNNSRTKTKYNFKSKKNDSRSKSKAKSNFSSKREKFNKTRKMNGGFLPKFLKKWSKNKVKPEPPKRPTEFGTSTNHKPLFSGKSVYSHLTTVEQLKSQNPKIYGKLSSSPLPVHRPRTLSIKPEPGSTTAYKPIYTPLSQAEQLNLTREKLIQGGIYSEPERQNTTNENIYSSNEFARIASNGNIYNVPMVTTNKNVFLGKKRADFLSSNGKTYNVPMEITLLPTEPIIESRVSALTRLKHHKFKPLK